MSEPTHENPRYVYLVMSWDWTEMQGKLNDFSAQGWRLHSIIGRGGTTVVCRVILERDAE
jgi:hypothetical protein